jgi:hypothetical protein
MQFDTKIVGKQILVRALSRISLKKNEEAQTLTYVKKTYQIHITTSV